MNRRLPAAAALLAAAGCVAATVSPPRHSNPLPARAAPADAFTYTGELTQGGWLRGQAPAGTQSARLGDQPLVLDRARRFFAAFDRDAGPSATLVATLADGRTVQAELAIAPRQWDIQRVDVPLTVGKTTEEFLALRKPELAQIAAARAVQSATDGWQQHFIWPAKGRISGKFGSQRIYRGGVAGAYHSGIDIAAGAGAPIVAPADGVVVLAAEQPFTLEGHLLIVDHGAGLNSAFLHCSRLAVKVGDAVRQGQPIAYVGMTGRATGPHLHWSLMWRGARLDPLLFTGPNAVSPTG
jgi:murein DD-endopeptidase MepM/ murein hydrolase activator NlpD